MRKIFGKLHLWLSVPLGLIVTVICLSGASLVFEQEVTRALHPHLYRIEMPTPTPTMTAISTSTSTLPPSQLVARLHAQLPDTLRVATLQLPGDLRRTGMATFAGAGRQTLSFNPATGEALGWVRTPAFFQTMRRLHRWLLDAPPAKGAMSAGKAVVGVTTLLLAVILVSGVVLWIPRTLRGLKPRLQVTRRHGWRRFWYDSHVTLGFYATALLLVMALTGLTWSFGWYRTAAYALFGGSAPTQPSQASQAPASAQPWTLPSTARRTAATVPATASASTSNAAAVNYAAWDTALSELTARYPTFGTITLGAGTAQIVADARAKVRRSDTATFDPQNGRLERVVEYGSTPRSQRLRGWFYAFHTGSWGGIWTKTLYFLAALIGGSLPLTGYYLWLRRRAARRKLR